MVYQISKQVHMSGDYPGTLCYLFRFLFPALPPFPLPPFPEGRFHRVPHVAQAFNRISLNAGKLNIDKHTEQTIPVDIGNPVSKQVALRSTLDALRR
jgi:hypothetical protein